jgi:phosphoribosylformylglycinamidine cyclo-ligase
VIAGVARGCRENGCALLGGETAEMPGFYADGEYDIAGTIVGVVEKSKVIDGRTIAVGDAVIGLPSAGLHTNGYSLARRVMFDVCGLAPDQVVSELGMSAGAALLAPHRSYLSAARPLISANLVKGMAHITGGGITENLPRILPEGTAAAVSRDAWTVPPIFRFLQAHGGIADDEMLRAFNMGIGLVIVCAPAHAGQVTDALTNAGEDPVRLGAIVAGAPSVLYRRSG